MTRISGWVERHATLSLFLPAVLPPPFPLTPFLLASGALGVPRRRFLQVYGAARSLRYGLVTWLGVAYGRGVVRAWSGTLEKWSPIVLWVFAGMLIGGIAFGMWRVRRERRSEAAEDVPLPAFAVRAG